ncbi:MAG: nucleotidyltransferase domain-containing protein [Spirochaetaceae bacterium]
MSRAADRLQHAVEVEFLAKLKDAFGGRLDAVVLYGSYVEGSFHPGVSDINVLVLLSEPDPGALVRFAKTAGGMMRKRRITPLILTSGEFARSSDVFPMEYLDIAARHRVLYGEDPTAALDVDRRNLRHQLEHQMRGNLISLRQLVLAARGRRRRLGRELTRWYGPVAAVFRGLLRLKDVEPVPTDPRALISSVNEAFGLEPGPFLQLVAYRNGESADPVRLADALLLRLSDLVEIVDRMES